MKSLRQVWAAAQRIQYAQENAASEQAAQQPTIETGEIRQDGILEADQQKATKSKAHPSSGALFAW
ncbi:MAG: hypothetical protein J6M56_14900 [Clostridia bacterium]|nr:hypothetical protein [Clostridia bacterium]